MSTNQLYHTWFERIKQLRPHERVTRLRTFAWLIVGIYQSRSVHLSKIAGKIPGPAKLLSITRRLGRFLTNPAVRVREWYEPIARALLQSMAVTGVGDSEFGAVEVIRQLEAWKWGYVLRQKAKHQVKLAEGRGWQNFGDVIHKPGQSMWLGRGLLTGKYAHPVNLLAHWKAGEDEPWLLVTNLSSRQAALKAYRRRMWIDEMFGDLKGNGFDLESTHLRNFVRLSRLTLAVVLLYVWLVSMGVRAIKNGQRRLVDRADRRDLSIFQIGLRLADRYLTNALSFSIRLCPVYGCKVSGS